MRKRGPRPGPTERPVEPFVPPLATIDRLPQQADVLVVGSGAGGGPTAALFAEAGVEVVVIEEGELRQGDVVPFSLEQMNRQYRAGGVTAALGRPAIAYAEGCCVGGGTEINSGLYRRPRKRCSGDGVANIGSTISTWPSCTRSVTKSSES